MVGGGERKRERRRGSRGEWWWVLGWGVGEDVWLLCLLSFLNQVHCAAIVTGNQTVSELAACLQFLRLE